MHGRAVGKLAGVWAAVAGGGGVQEEEGLAGGRNAGAPVLPPFATPGLSHLEGAPTLVPPSGLND